MRVLTSQSIFWYDYVVLVVFFKQKTAYEMRISDWSSDVCSSDLRCLLAGSRPPRIGSSNTTSATTTINAAKPINSGITMHPPIRACLPYLPWRGDARSPPPLLRRPAKSVAARTHTTRCVHSYIGRAALRDRVCQTGTYTEVS